MAKILNSTVHGVLDYALAFMFLLMPGIFDFPAAAANLSYAIGAAYLGVSLLTRYPLGALKIIPFPTHGVLETLMAISWLAFPWLFGFSGHEAARNFFLIAGVALLAVVMITDYRLHVTTTPGMRHA